MNKNFYDVYNESKIAEDVGNLPTIYCDMDMVLCDFIGGTEEVLNVPFPKQIRPKESDDICKERFLGNTKMDAWF